MSHKLPLWFLIVLTGLLLAVPALAQTPTVEPGVACTSTTPCPDPATSAFTMSDTAIAVAAAAEELPAEAASEGFWLAWAVMVVLVLAFLYAIVAAILAALGHQPPALRGGAALAIPILSVIGLGVAIYLTILETSTLTPFCGPVGDCGAVQASPFAKLFGFLPVGLLGAGGYVLILAAWFVGRFGSGALARLAPLALFAMALFGVLFSIYLTYLELFIIRAVCIWCVTSAFIMAFTLILSVGPAVDALFAEE